MATTLHMVPEGRNIAASLPSSAAIAFAQGVHGRIVAVLLVADLGAHHRLPHAGVGRVCVSE